MKNVLFSSLFVLLVVLLVACNGGRQAGVPDPANMVERYLQAKISGDSDTIRELLCSEMEAELERELHAFDTVADARLEDVSCIGINAFTVSCEGRIVATYGTEETEFPLSTYRIVDEDNTWKWCGEASQ